MRVSHLIENLADSQEQYQMAFIKCQYTNDYILTNKIHSVISSLFRIKNVDTETGWNVRILR